MTLLVAVLVALMIAAALVAIQGSGILAAIVSVGAVGFLSAIAFLLLGAPDLAIVQVAVEVIALTLLIRAVSGREPRDGAGAAPEPAHLGFVGVSVAVTLVAVTGAFALRAASALPEFGRSVMQRFADAPSVVYLGEGLERTGAPNIVSAVLLDFRAYDTLGEATVLFCAVLGVVTVARRRARTGGDAKAGEEEVE